ncbi:hypothetical protein AAVH_32425 [Aphelenchoides avenae]|nr:hypothetical protein AAVH_32425 [Aphelenchus avenae]
MTSPIAVVILAILPALARQSERDMTVERLKRVHDLDSLYEEISAEGDRALITMAIIPAVYLYSARVERFLGEHKDFAMEFGPFARRASYLARMYLYKGLIEGELVPPADEELAEAVVYFERWLEQLRQRGLITYDPTEEPRYVRPGVDPSTEELRSVLRLRHNLSAEVPADPIAGGELSIHVTLPSKILGTLCMAPPGL